MNALPVPGTQGYAEEAAQLIARYEGIAFADKYAAVLPLLPETPGTVLDIGAGTGADAAWLAARGHAVTAVEPLAAFREAGMAAHGARGIAWIDDSLPLLATLETRAGTFDTVLLAAVWMHLAPDERGAAMERVAALLKPGGVLVMSLRHGSVPAGRCMFDVPVPETVVLAERNGLRLVFKEERASVQVWNRQADVRWSWLVFRR